MSARLYNTDTGEVLQAKYTSAGTGHGKIQLTMGDGSVLEGEYTTLDASSFDTSYGTANAYAGGQYAWAMAQGFSFSSPGVQYGSAVCAGGGRVIEIVYQTSIWTAHGFGVGKDNKGGRYRLQF